MHLKSRGLAAIARKGLTIFLASILVFDGVPTAALAEALDAADAVMEEALVEEEVSEEELPEEGLPEEVDSGEGLPEQEPSDQSEPLDAEGAGEPEALPEEAAEEIEPVDDEQEAPAVESAPDDSVSDHEEASAPEYEEEPALTAQADEDLVASGEWGECSWSIDNDGLLRIWPTNGTSGTLAESLRTTGECFPWSPYSGQIVSVVVDAGVKFSGSLYGMFYECSQLKSLDASDWDVSAVTEMTEMFWGCAQLEVIDVSNWDVSRVTDMWGMFGHCSSLVTLDLSGWNSSLVKDLSSFCIECTKLEAVDLSNLDTSNVTSMHAMFWECPALVSVCASGWDTSLVTDMGAMFVGCPSLTSLDVSNWETSSVTEFTFMFDGCSSLPSLDVSNWDTSSANGFPYMFEGCSSLPSLDVSGWDTSSATDFTAMFNGCSSLASLDVSSWDTSSVADMSSMFSGCSSLSSLDVSDWDTSSATGMCSMFSRCSSLPSLDVSDWDTSSVSDFSHMFNECSSLPSLDVSKWDTSSVANLSSMFFGCELLPSLDVSSWDTSSATDFSYMFYRCSSLSSLDVSGWDTSAVTDMSAMLGFCSLLPSLDMSNWDTSSVTSFYQMLFDCSSLETLDLSSWSSSSVQNSENMLHGLSKVTAIKVGSSFDLSRVFPYPGMETETGKWWSAAEGAWFDTETIRAERAYQADTYTTYIPYGFLEGAEVTFAPGTLVFDGAETRPSISLSFDGEPLVEGTDYVVSYEDNVNAGTATVRVTGIGDWRGEVLRTYEIARRPVVITADSFTKSYGDPDPVFTAQVEGLIDGYTVDYELVREPGEGLGTYAITPTGETVQGNYELTFQSGTLVIDSASLQQATVAEIADQVFTGSAVTPSPVVSLGGETLVEGTDYTVSYQDNVNAGIAAVIITGIGKYSDSTEQSFTIAPKPVTVTANSATKTHGQDDPVFGATVDGTVGSDTISYTISREAGERPGTYVVTANGAFLQGNYSVTFVSGSLEITGVSMAEATLSSIATQAYSGSALKPSVTVSHAGMRLEEGTDYTVTYQNNTNAGTATVIVKGVGAFWDQKTTTFTIAPKAVTVRADNLSKGYGEADPELTATVIGLIGSDDVTYSLARALGEAVGTYGIVATGDARQGNYQVTFQNGTFTISETPIAGATVSAIPNQTYTGSALTPQPLVTLGGRTLSLGTDYSLSYRNNVDVGTATVVIAGMGGYAGSISKTFVVSPKAATVTADSLYKEIGQADPALTATVEGLVGNDELVYTLSREAGEALGTYAITATGNVLQGNYRVTYKPGVLTIGRASISVASVSEMPVQTYGGVAREPKPTVTLNGRTLVEGRDYTLSYRDNVNVGTATVIVSGAGDYAGSVDVTFTIAPKAVTVRADNLSKGYGEADPELTATVSGLIGSDGVSYSLSRAQGEAVGTYTIVATGTARQGNYQVTFQNGTFTIGETLIGGAAVSAIPNQTYTGSGLTPQPLVTLGGKTLSLGTDYSLSYRNNVNVGTATVTISGMGGYAGSLSKTFVVSPKAATVTADSMGKEIGQADPALTATVEGLVGNDKLVYTLSRKAGEALGTYAITATGNVLQGNYRVTYKPGVLTIGLISIARATIDGIPQRVYDGTAQVPKVIVTLDGKTLVEGRDYTLTYRNNVDPGTATVIVSGTGDYGGSVEATFVIVPRPVTVTAVSMSKAIGEPDPALSANVKGVVGGDTVSYELAREAGELPGTYAITASGDEAQGNYLVTFVGGQLVIDRAAIADVVVEPIADQVYSGEAIEPELSVSVRGMKLERGRDYTVSFADNTNAGQASVVVTGAGAFEGSITRHFAIAPREVTVRALNATKTYGTEDPLLRVTTSDTAGDDAVSYEIAREPGENVGTYAITPIGDELQGNYRVTFVPGTLEVTPRMVTVTPDNLSKDYGEVDPALTATVDGLLDGDTIEYTLSRESGEAHGTYSITAIGDELQGNYQVAFGVGTFEIIGVSIATASVAAIPNHEVTGRAVEPKPEVTLGGKTLVLGQDYVLSYRNNVSAGTAIVVVRGIGKYFGEVTATFKIEAKSLEGAKVRLSKLQYKKSEVPAKPDVTVCFEADDGGEPVYLVKDVDYTVSYLNNTAIGTATAVITGKGSYEGTLEAKYWIASTVDTGTFSNGLTYSYASRVLIIGGEGEMTSPPPIKGSWSRVETVIIQEGVTSICDNAFSSLRDQNRLYVGSVSLPKSLTHIGAEAFRDSRLTEVTIPCNVTSIGNGAFEWSKSLKTIVFEEGTAAISPKMFYFCEKLESVTFAKSITAIGDEAFEYCDHLTSVVLGPNVESIGERAFYGCKALQTAVLEGGNRGAIGETAFEGTALTSLSIGAGYISIGESAFSGIVALKSLSLPSGLISIEDGAFSGCAGLTSAALPASLRTIGDYAFRRCAALSGVMLPNDLRSIGNYAFESCSAAFGKKLVIPRNVITIGDHAFDMSASGSSIETVEFTGNAPSLGSSAFRGITADAIYPAGNKTWTADIMRDCDGEFTWYMRKSNGELEKEPYHSPYETVELTEELNSKDFHWLGGYGSPCISSVSFDMAVAKRSQICVAVRWGTGEYCVHESLSLDLKDNYGNKLRMQLIGNGKTYSGETLFVADCPAGTAHLEALYMDSHNHQSILMGVKYFILGRLDISNAKVSSLGTYPTTGKAVKPSPKVTMTRRELEDTSYLSISASTVTDTLKAGRDYTLTYKNNVKAGTASVTIKGKGRYTGSKTIKFKLADPKPLSKTKINAIGTQWWKGKKLTPVPVIKDGNKTLKKGTDFTVTYTNNAKVGKATVTIKGKGLYKGTVKRTFNIKNISGTWKKSGSRWWYEWKDGTYPKSVFYTISGKTYRFDASGYMLTGWQKVGSKYYFFGSDGVMRKNTWAGNYYLKADGTMATNEWVDGGKYWVGANGAWVKDKTR